MSNAKKAKWAPPEPVRNDKCVVAWISPGQTSMFFTASMYLMVARDARTDRHLANILPLHSGVNVSHARNHLTDQFLDNNTDADWLLWIDSDMEFEPDTMHRLIASADPVERPIVGALCFGEDSETGLFPTVYRAQRTPEGKTAVIRLGDYPEDAMFRVYATGAAFLLIHRTVLEAVRAQNYSEVFPFFQELELYDKPVGEDIAFCARAGATRTETWPEGIPVYVNTSVEIGHHKSHMLTAAKFRQEQGRKAVAPPATERVSVVVPVLGRPKNARPFVESLRASTGLATVLVMVEESDTKTLTAWREMGVVPIVTDAHTFAEKVNAAVEHITDPWTLIVGDDVRFHPGWLDHALARAGDRFDVVGTNDLGNPRVVAGEHATHILLRTSYIKKVGASWDGPGLIAHEGYGHWYVDDEIVTAAKQRDVWTAAHGSVIEHLHPLWGKAEEDDTYLAGQETRFEDEALYKQRLQEFGGGYVAA